MKQSNQFIVILRKKKSILCSVFSVNISGDKMLRLIFHILRLQKYNQKRRKQDEKIL